MREIKKYIMRTVNTLVSMPEKWIKIKCSYQHQPCSVVWNNGFFATGAYKCKA